MNLDFDDETFSINDKKTFPYPPPQQKLFNGFLIILLKYLQSQMVKFCQKILSLEILSN